MKVENQVQQHGVRNDIAIHVLIAHNQSARMIPIAGGIIDADVEAEGFGFDTQPAKIVADQQCTVETGLVIHLQSPDRPHRAPWRERHVHLRRSRQDQLAAEAGDAATTLATGLRAAAMADRAYADPSNRQASACATLAEARLADNDPVGAVDALRRARRLLAAVVSPTPSVERYLAKVAAQLCVTPDLPDTECTATH